MKELERQFAQTVAEQKSTIYTVCYMFSQDADEVNDLFQEVLVNLWKGFESFEEIGQIVGIPALILWLAWFFYEVYKQNHDLLMHPLFWAGCVGGIIGAIIGFSIHFKTQRQYQEIIDQIEELTAEN